MLLEPRVLIGLLILYPLVACLSLLTVFLHIRRPLGIASKYGQGLIIIAIIGLCALIMEICALQPAVQPLYHMIRTISLYIFSIVLMIFFVHLLIAHRHRKTSVFMSPDFNAIFLAIDDLVVVVDLEGNIIDCNHPESFITLFGQGVTTIHQVFDLLNVNHWAFTSSELSPQSPEELYCYYDVQAFRISQSEVTMNHQVVATAFVFQDITALRSAEKDLEAHNQALEATNKKLENAVALGHHLEVEEERLQLIEALQLDLISRIEKTNQALSQLMTSLPDTAAERLPLLDFQATELRDLYGLLRKTLFNYTGKGNR